jgi:hypothetical protein
LDGRGEGIAGVNVAGAAAEVDATDARKSSDGGATLNGIRLGGGGAKGEGKGVGTGGPLEAGTLSGTGTPIPFGENLGLIIGRGGAASTEGVGGADGAAEGATTSLFSVGSDRRIGLIGFNSAAG